MADNDYETLEDLQGSEEIETQTEDFFEPERPLALPGWYFSPPNTREITWKKGNGGHYTFKVQQTGGMTAKVAGVEDGTDTKLIPMSWLTTHKLKSNFGQGEISSVRRYLNACGITPQDDTIEALGKAIKESLGTGVYLRVGWEDDYRERKPGEKAKARTKAFNKGSANEPIWTPQITLASGEKVTASAKVEEYMSVENFEKRFRK